MRFGILPVLGLAMLLVAPPAPANTHALLETLLALDPQLPAEPLAHALEARECAVAAGAAPRATRLALIDYSRPSTEVRLWVLDLEAPRVLHAEHVAHGRGSGANLATAFSNVEGSHQSSLGLFVTADTYQGGNGYSLRLDGLDPGINDRARERYIVMHGAPYVDPAQGLLQGRLGRSLGCPALRPEVARAVIDELREGQLVFAWYPDDEWLQRSPWIGCSAPGGGGDPALLASP